MSAGGAAGSPALRRQMAAARRGLDPAEAARLSQTAVARFLADCGIATGEWRELHVALYRALPGELDLRPLESELQKAGALLCFPRVLDRLASTMEMAQARVTAAGSGGMGGADPSQIAAWPPGAFGVEEPPAAHPAVDPGILDVIFVPGAAFGPRGERVGMGAGFYDRYLVQAPRALKVALAFDFQLVDGIKPEPWDQPVDWIWTEKRSVQLRPWSPVRK